MTQKQSPDNYDTIRERYQALSTELPSSEIDESILAKARLQARVQARVQEKAPTGSTRKWQWPLSIAASVLLVSVLYLNNTGIYQQPVAEHEVPESFVPSLARPLAEESKQKQQEEMARTREVDRKRQAEEQVKQEARKARSLAPPVPTVQSVQAPSEPEMAASLSDSDISSDLDIEYLEAIAGDIFTLSEKIAESSTYEYNTLAAVPQNEEPEQKRIRLQKELYEYLFDKQQSAPEVNIPEKYLSLLTISQQDSLSKLRER